VPAYIAKTVRVYSKAGNTVKATDNKPRSAATLECVRRAIVTFGFFLILSSSQAGGVKILGYDTPAYIDFEQVSFEVSEDQTNLVIGISRTGEYRQQAQVDFSLIEGTATEGKDYKPVGGTLVFAAGQGFKTITIPILQDSEAEPDETFTIEFSNPSANAFLMHTNAAVTIKDVPPVIKELPSLKIAPGKDGTIAISWEQADGCVLERSDNPALGTWETLPVTPELYEGRYVVVQPVTNTFYAYRLRGS
jgi:hypothetical protein